MIDSTFSCHLIGADTLLIECGNVLLERGHDIRGVVTATPRIRAWAEERGIETIDPAEDWAARLRSRPFDYLFSITHLSILPDEVLEIPSRMAINFHDGPLPAYAGLNTPVWAILNGESSHGISWHVMTSGVDRGDLLRQQGVEIAADETALSLNTKCMAAALESFPKLVDDLASGRVERTPQDPADRSYFGRHDRPEPACLIDWSADADRIETFVRALTFGPYRNPVGSPWTSVASDEAFPFVVVDVEVVEGSDDGAPGAPGEVLEVDDAGMLVAAGTGRVRIGSVRTLDGRVHEARAAAESIGAAPGTRLIGHDSDTAARLAEAHEPITRAEPFWERRLLQAEAPNMPLAVPSDLPARWESLHFETGSGDAEAADIVGAWATCLARMGRTESLHLAWATGEEPSAWISPTAPMALDLDPEWSFDRLAEQVREEIDRLRTHRGFWRDLVLRVPGLADRAELAEDRILPVGVSVGRGAPAGSLLSLDVATDGTGFTIHYDVARLSAKAAAAIADAVVTVLGAEDRTVRWSALPMLSAGVRRRVLRDWNDTSVSWPSDRCVHHLVEAQVDRTPDSVAVVFEDATLTYAELDRRANALAHLLRDRGVGPDDLVGVHVSRSLDLPVAVLGVLKSGGAWLPLDPEFPADRLAFMIGDAGAKVIVTQSAIEGGLPDHDASLILLDRDVEPFDAPVGDEGSGTSRPESAAGPSSLAYAIYTSGSTGTPKGVLVEHRNVVNFFTGMGPVIEHEPPGTWMAVTSLSFDIAVLELVWTLTRGFTVVVYAGGDPGSGPQASTVDPEVASRPMDFGLFMWGNDDGPGPDKYRLMMDGARYFDRNGFHSVWTPERHFHAFGGPFPNPSVTGAALAAVTENIRIRSGSCVSPLHHPIRIAEEWSVVDNLSDGRVDLSFAAGWQPNDFILRPESWSGQKQLMFEQIETVRRLWRGEAVEFENPVGKTVEIRTLPRPVQPELPFWVTTAGNPDTYEAAGAMGANVLTHLLGQDMDEVAGKIEIYRRAREEAGLDPAEGKISLMLHTFVGDDDDRVRELVRGPMKDYLRSSMKLVLGFAWTFPAFKRPGGAGTEPEDVDLGSLSDEETDAILDFAFERYYETSGLFGTVESCVEMVQRCKAIGVDEIACLLDFGVDTDRVMDSLPLLKRVKDLTARPEPRRESPSRPMRTGFATQVERHDVTHLQCTPSMARLLLADPEARRGVQRIPHLLIGGEAFPPDLASELSDTITGTLTNMYGPTETTIWSSTHPVDGAGETVPIGRPIANTRMYVLDRYRNPLPPGVPGDLWIGGEGVTRGYHERPGLTAGRFVPDPFTGPSMGLSGESSSEEGARMYHTGDLARFRHDGVLEFLGRVDRQVKHRGYRIELEEIEAVLDAHEAVRMSAVLLREDGPGQERLVAWVVPDAAEPGDEELRRHLRTRLPEYMIPSAFVLLDRMPLTPNGKIDRGALPAPSAARTTSRVEHVDPESEIEHTLVECWKQTLQVDRIGVEDNFFDVGGHSLLVVQLHRILSERISQQVSLVDLYRFPTIRALTRHLESDGGDEGMTRSIERAERRRKAMADRRRRG